MTGPGCKVKGASIKYLQKSIFQLHGKNLDPKDNKNPKTSEGNLFIQTTESLCTSFLNFNRAETN